MQLKPRNKLVSGAFANTYQDRSAKGDRPRAWSWHHKRAKPGKCIAVPLEKYLSDEFDQEISRFVQAQRQGVQRS